MLLPLKFSSARSRSIGLSLHRAPSEQAVANAVRIETHLHLAAAVLPLSTAFVVCEAFGAERSVQSRFGEAPLFFGLFILLLATGAVVVALLGPSSIAAVAIGTQTLDGILLPVLLVFILILANDRRLLGRYRNGPFNNAVAGVFTVVLSALTAYLVLTTLTGL